MLWNNAEQQEIERIIIRGAEAAATIEDIVQIEIGEWETSKKREWMLIGDRYYRNNTDVLDRKRTAIGESGAKEPVANLANNKLNNAFIRKLTDQKVSYLLGKPMSIQTDDDKYTDLITGFFDKNMYRNIQSTGKESVNKGIAWWYVHYDLEGKLTFKKMNSEECIPIWSDQAHTKLDAMIRDYKVTVYDGKNRTTVRKIEWHDTRGIRRWEIGKNGFFPDVDMGVFEPHFTVKRVDGEAPEEGRTWKRVPFIAFKYNEEEQPLVEIIKNLVDDYDRNKSDNSSNLEDLPNSLYVVKGYGGTSVGEIRKNLAVHRIIKIDDPDDNSGVEAISLNIDTEAYKTHQEQNRKDIYEFGRGVDTQAANFGSAPSGVALRFLYSDLDLDASMMEMEYQASMEQVKYFIDQHLIDKNGVDYSNKKVEFIFNRDMPIDEESIIKGISESTDLSRETRIAQHPWVRDPKAELERVEKEEKDKYTDYPDPNLDGEE